MARYILIDNNSGFIWGDTHAAAPVDAMRQVDEGIGEFGRSYTEHAPRALRTTATGCFVYEAPADFPEIENGQDQREIEAVSALPCVAFVAAERPADDDCAA